MAKTLACLLASALIQEQVQSLSPISYYTCLFCPNLEKIEIPIQMIEEGNFTFLRWNYANAEEVSGILKAAMIDIESGYLLAPILSPRSYSCEPAPVFLQT